jgi:hypothetical protein
MFPARGKRRDQGEGVVAAGDEFGRVVAQPMPSAEGRFLLLSNRSSLPT